MRVGGQRPAPVILPRGKRPAALFTGGSVSCGVNREGCEDNLLSPPGFEPRTFQSVASRYIDYAIPALCGI